MATTFLSLSSPTLLQPTSPFKGTTTALKPTIRPYPYQKTQFWGTQKRPIVAMTSQSSPAVGVGSLSSVRLRLDNLGPQPGSRKKGKRKGRGESAGQGGVMPLYRRIPKLRGIAGGMRAGLPKFVPVNLKDIAEAGFQEGDEVSLESLKEKGLINPSGRERRLPLKILGDGELTVKLNVKARAFSAAAKEKLEAAGCSLTHLPGRKKWVKPSVAKNLARAEEYFAKKRAAAADQASA
ncbi:hypothetical protein Syun_021744 [Stephania yunnanensis]|uniref:Large ribosomal subunit protein uL15/eL18 domain-containing protein n=1 Tax=Stephania yunnanensis TaxID=152371 RepID=A0AAP0II38_9MAGN